MRMPKCSASPMLAPGGVRVGAALKAVENRRQTVGQARQDHDADQEAGRLEGASSLVDSAFASPARTRKKQPKKARYT